MKNKKLAVFGLLTLMVVTLSLCKKREPVKIPVAHDITPYMLDIGSFPEPDIAADNPLTIEGVQLGRMLFFEKRMSKNGQQACAGCHLQGFAFSDTARLSIGVEGLPGKRQAMAVFNMAWHSNEFFWDGRAHLLRDQSLKPIQDPLEMNETLENVISKLDALEGYRDQFKRAFGDETITSERMSLAMEQFMNSIVSNNSKYDRYLAGTETLSTSEERGRILYFQEYNAFLPDQSGADCAHCHGGFNFENDQYMNNGLDTDANITDIGREEVTGNASDKGKFKVPSLRNIEFTPPYMHDGRFTTLEQVVDHYNTGIQESSTVDQALRVTKDTGLRLDPQQKADLVAFLKTLSDPSLFTDERYSDPFE